MIEEDTEMPTALNLADNLEHLPDRIRQLVEKASAGTLVLALKTTYKPNSTIPSIWLVLTSDALLLCNTHSTRGLWGRYSRTMLPSLRLGVTSASRVYLDLHAPSGTVTLTLSEKLARGDIERFLAEYRRLGGRS